jgi:hypothetical protein
LPPQGEIEGTLTLSGRKYSLPDNFKPPALDADMTEPMWVGDFVAAGHHIVFWCTCQDLTSGRI